MDLLNKHEEQQGNGLSYELWKNFPVVESLALRDLNVGYGVYPDLVSFNTTSGGAATYTDSSSTIAQLTEAQGGVGGGIRVFNTADNEEASIQWCGGAGSPFRISNVAGEERELVFECRFRTDVITDAKAGFFIGLAEEGLAAANTITDAGALADKDAIGFHRLEGDGATLDFVYQKAGQTAQTVKADWKTIAASTWYHVGLRYNATNKTVRAYFGTGDRTTAMRADDTNIVTSANIDAATFPNSEGLAPLVSCKNAHADDHNLDIGLIACGQAAIAAT